MRGRLEQRFVVFSGGVRKTDATLTGAAPSKIPSGAGMPGRAPGTKGRREELADGLNVLYDRRTGLLRRRNAHASVTSLTGLGAVVTSMMVGSSFPAGAADQILISNGASIWKYSFGALTGAAVMAGLTAGSLWHSVMAPQSGGQGPMYLMNGPEARYWTGAVAGNWTASTGTLPLGRYLAAHERRVWIANLTNALSVDPKSTLGWSEEGDPRNYPAANITMFDPNDGDEITGIGRIGPYLLLFKRRKTWLIYDLATSANRQLSAAIGCISHRSIVETPHGTIFMSERGPAICDGATIRLIEDKLDLMAQINLTDTQLDLTRWITAASTGDDYYINVTPELITGPFAPFLSALPAAQYDVINDAWWPYDRAMEQMAVWDGSGENELWAIDNGGLPGDVARTLSIMFGDAGSDRISDSGPAGATDLIAYAQLRDVDFGTDRRKVLRSLTVEGNAVVTPSMYADGVSALGTARDLTSASGLRRATWPRPAGARPAQRLGVKLSAGLAGGAINPPPFEIAAVTIHADDRVR